jgi:hypothetical protein
VVSVKYPPEANSLVDELELELELILEELRLELELSLD